MNNIGWIFVAFITIVVGLALVGSITDQIHPITTAYPVVNESLDITTAREADAMSLNESIIFTLDESNWSNTPTIAMSNGTALTADTDYVIYTNETLYFKNTSTTWAMTTNLTGATYSHYTDVYVADSFSRVIIGLIVIFFVLGIFAFVWKSIKESGFEWLQMK